MITRYSWYPVRSRCQPAKLLGFLRLEDGNRNVVAADGESYSVEIKRMTRVRYINPLYLSNPTSAEPIYDEELAVDSEDRGIEFWRTVPDFIESPASD